MAYPKHFLLAWGGFFLDTLETWSCTLRLTSDAVAGMANDAMVQTAADNVAQVHTKCATFCGSLGSTWNSSAWHQWTKFNAIGPDGRYIGDTTSLVELPPGQGSVGGSTGPFDASLAITLRTGYGRGLAAYGRFYVPVANLVHAKGRIVNGVTTAVAEASAAFLTSLNDWEGIDVPGAPNVCVVSRGRELPGGGYGPGAFRVVERVEVGDILDTQQRRRRQLKEAYIGADVAS